MTLRRSHFNMDALLALLGTSLVASLDELHQAHLPNRTGSPWDALLDCSGALILQLVVYIYMRLERPKYLSHAE
jgi:VanZ family protein